MSSMRFPSREEVEKVRNEYILKDAVWFLSGWMICKHRQLERKEQ